MIRPLSSAEVHLCVDGGNAFFDEGKMPGGFDGEHFCKMWRGLIDAGIGVILGSFTDDGKTITGAIGAVISPNLFSNTKLAVESFWFVFPQYRGHGIRLLKAFEEWGKSSGADFLCMIHLEKL